MKKLSRVKGADENISVLTRSNLFRADTLETNLFRVPKIYEAFYFAQPCYFMKSPYEECNEFSVLNL